MKLIDRFWIALILKGLDWLAKNTDARIYSSPVPEGRRIGGKDVPEVANLYLVFSVKVAGRCIFLGYFQTT